jgi:putative transposase
LKQGQFSEEQILAILQQAERGDQSIQAVCREHNVSENTFYRWRARFGKAAPGDATKSRELAQENARLKRLLAERDLENDILKELLAKK